MIKIGFWNSSKDGCLYPSWQERLSEKEKKLLISHIEKSKIKEKRPKKKCLLCDALIDMTEACDNVFIFRKGLAHYIEQHQILLPDSFIIWARIKGKVNV